MELAFSVAGVEYTARADVFHDISIEVSPYAPSSAQTECFHLPTAAAAPFTAGTFVASIDAGASINCPVVSSLCPHSNGTHTECVGHALPGAVTLRDIAPM
jgi:arylformamidase